MTSAHQHIQNVALSALHPNANNPRTHSKKKKAQLAKSIDRFGWTNPIIIDENMGVLAGHGRLEPARLLGLT